MAGRPGEGPAWLGSAAAVSAVPSAPGFGGGRPVVLQVIPALEAGGAERGCVDVAVAIQRAGGRALVASEGGPMVRELERAGVKHVTLPVARKSPLALWRNADRLAGLMVQEGVDLLHARSRAPAWSCLWASRRLGVPFVTTVHAPYPARNRMKRAYNAVMARGDRVIAISRFIERYVAEGYGVGPDRLRLVHRGVDVARLAPESVTEERQIALLKAWRVSPDRRIVLLPARLTRWKGQTVLVEALARLGREDVHAVLVGADQGRLAYRRELVDRVVALGLSERVTIAEHCQDMPAAYALADVVVSASVEPEAFGRVVVEAQAMGRPVIVTRVGAVEETVVEGETGLVIPPNDPDALAEALTAALDLTPEERRAIGADARAHVLAHFTKDRMCAETLAVYADLLSERGWRRR